MAVIRGEILQIADSVAREKGIEKEQVIQAMEEAIQKLGRSKYGIDKDIRAKICTETGEISLSRYRILVETVENPDVEILASEAHHVDPSLKIGEFLVDELPPIEFGRVSALSARQVIGQRVREAEKEKQYNEFKERLGQIVTGIVKRVEFGNYIIEVERAEALLRRDESIPREMLHPGDRVRAYVMEVKRDMRNPQVLLSRSHPQFMARLFAQEVPEIEEGIIEILAVARDPGSKAKIAVRSKDSSIDPVGSCVGIRGSRVQGVVNELQGEKVDIVPWNENVPTFVINALSPAEIAKVIYDEAQERVEVVVPDEQLSIAIGRRGQNVRLASLLTGLDISIRSESDDAKNRMEQFKQSASLFKEALDVDEVIAHLLVAEGFHTVDEIVATPLEEMSTIEGFDADLASEIINRAATFIEARNKELQELVKKLNVEEALINLDGMTNQILIKLAKKKITTLDDFADLASDELLEILDDDTLLSSDEANKLILAARAHWFKD